jgi:lactate 2-monooxygenase
VANECAKQGIPYIYSTAASTTLEEVAQANGAGERWFQLYWPQSKDSDITLSMLSRAEKSGYSVLVITVDLWALSWRPSMLDNPQQLEPGLDTATGFVDPVFKARYEREAGKSVQDDLAAAARAWRRIVFPGEPRTWDELKFIRDQWRGKLVLKGEWSYGNFVDSSPQLRCLWESQGTASVIITFL